MSRLFAVLLWWLAVLLVVAGVLIEIFDLLDLPLGLWIGMSLIVLGVNVLVNGDVVTTTGGKPFSARAQVSRAVLDISSGAGDVGVRAGGGYDRLASVQTGVGVRPSFKVVEGVARLRLGRGARWLPGEGDWQATLATDVLWDVNAKSLLGNVDIDLRGIRVDTVSIWNALGSVNVICPQRGRPVVVLDTWLGDLHVVLPDGVGARVRLRQGRLADVVLDEALFEQVDRTTFITRDLNTAKTVAEITLRVQAGGVRVSRA